MVTPVAAPPERLRAMGTLVEFCSTVWLEAAVAAVGGVPEAFTVMFAVAAAEVPLALVAV